MRTAKLSLLCIALWAASAAAAAQPTPIIVEGTRVEKLRSETYEFIRGLGTFSGDRQTARWINDVCPRAIGVDADVAAIIQRQIREIAAQAGARVAGANCPPNFLITFTTDASSFTQKVLERDPTAAREVRTAGQKALESGKFPVRWWYNTALATKDGRPVLAVEPAINNLPTGGGASVLTQYESGRISTGVVRGIESVAVVVDLNLAEGKLLRALVDYAALVGLSEVRLGALAPHSILSMFEPAAGIRGLTATDKAYLHALYGMAADRNAKTQRQALVDDMVRARSSQ